MGDESPTVRARPLSADAPESTTVPVPLRPLTPPTGPRRTGTENLFKQPELTPHDALIHDEVRRTRFFLILSQALLVLGILIALVVPGDPAVLRVLIVGCVLSCLCSTGFLVWIRDPSRYSPYRLLLPATVATAASVPTIYYFGVFSPAPMVFMLAIYFYSQSASRLAAAILYACCAAFLGLVMVLTLVGVLPDRGILHPSVAPWLRWLATVLIQVVYAATFAFGRVCRHSIERAVEGLDAALRQVRDREALLAEADRNFERALQVGVPWGRDQVGAWRLVQVIGRGGMGEVYEARHAESGQSAAVKVLHVDRSEKPQEERRFLREALILSRLESAHIVRVHEVGWPGEGPPYIAMELLVGQDLGRILRQRRRLPATEVVELVRQVAEALEHARRADIVHRDLKPPNLFRVESTASRVGPIWKVLDFGVSKLGIVAGTLTQANVIGTPGYMAPEQTRGAPVDHRADVFALAVIAYRALTGRPAFSGRELPKLLHDTVYVQPERPGELAMLDPDVDLALALGLAKEPSERPARAVDFAEALGHAVGGRLSEALRASGRAILRERPWSGGG